VPAAQQIVQQLFADIELMLQPLRSAGAVVPDVGAATAIYAHRLTLLRAEAPAAAADRLSPDAIEVLTRRGDTDSDGDSAHRLKSDLFKELNRLQALIADDVIDGAHTYGLGPQDAALISAFMKAWLRRRRSSSIVQALPRRRRASAGGCRSRTTSTRLTRMSPSCTSTARRPR
jgi:hypothetical protein